MNQEKRKNIALMRYSAIVPLISGSSDSYPSLSAFFRDVSAKGIKAPDGTIKHYAVSTLELWYVNYKKGVVRHINLGSIRHFKLVENNIKQFTQHINLCFFCALF